MEVDRLNTGNNKTAASSQIEEHVTTNHNETQVETNNPFTTPTNAIKNDYNIDSDYDDSWLASINDIIKEEQYENEETSE